MDCAVIGPCDSARSRIKNDQSSPIAQSVPVRLCPGDAPGITILDLMQALGGKRCGRCPHSVPTAGAHAGIVAPESIEHSVTGSLGSSPPLLNVARPPLIALADTSGEIIEVSGGNAGLTHGDCGTGGSLAGLIASLISRKGGACSLRWRRPSSNALVCPPS